MYATIRCSKNVSFQDQAEAKANELIIPLTVRHFATKIEDEFPDIKNNKSMIPAPVLKNTPSHSRHWVNRKYQFLEILKVGEKEENEYVVAILEELEKYYKKKYKTVTIDKKSAKYEKFLLRFCTSIVEAIQKGNEIAHQGTGSMVKIESLDLYTNIVDPFMTVFYNAIVGKKHKRKMEERMNNTDLDENEGDE